MTRRTALSLLALVPAMRSMSAPPVLRFQFDGRVIAEYLLGGTRGSFCEWGTGTPELLHGRSSIIEMHEHRDRMLWNRLAGRS